MAILSKIFHKSGHGWPDSYDPIKRIYRQPGQAISSPDSRFIEANCRFVKAIFSSQLPFYKGPQPFRQAGLAGARQLWPCCKAAAAIAPELLALCARGRFAKAGITVL